MVHISPGDSSATSHRGQWCTYLQKTHLPLVHISRRLTCHWSSRPRVHISPGDSPATGHRAKGAHISRRLTCHWSSRPMVHISPEESPATGPYLQETHLPLVIKPKGAHISRRLACHWSSSQGCTYLQETRLPLVIEPRVHISPGDSPATDHCGQWCTHQASTMTTSYSILVIIHN